MLNNTFTLDNVEAAITAMDDLSGTVSVFREIEWSLKRSALWSQRRMENQWIQSQSRGPSTTPLERFHIRVKLVIEMLTLNGELVCQTKQGYQRISYPQRITRELEPILDWIEIEHVRAAQWYLQRD